MTSRSVLVTGAAGFIGRDLVDLLALRGHPVRALVRPGRGRDLVGLPGVTVVDGDIRDRDRLGQALDGAWAVAHLAARKSDEPDSRAVNVDGAEALVSACRARGVRRIVNVSTQSAKLTRKGSYGSTKLEADRVLQASQLDVTTLRPSVVYGADVTGVFARMRHFMTRLPIVPVIGDGRWRSRPVYVRDVSLAILACLERDATIGKTYDWGGPDEVSMDEFLDAIGRTLGLRRPKLHVPALVGLLAARALGRLTSNSPVTVSNVLGSTQYTACDPAPAVAELGVAPLSLDQGLQRMLDDEVRTRLAGEGPVLRVAVVGLGKMGLFHAALLRTIPNVRLVAVADPNVALESSARSMGFHVPFHTSLDALLATTRPDAALICTPTFAHYDAVRRCLEHGVHVLVEKPLTETSVRSAELAALGNRQAVVHAVGYHLAYSPLYERARTLVRDGTLGELMTFRGQLQHAEVLGAKKGWMFDPARAGGGLVRNTASHLIFLLEYFFGTPNRLSAKTESVHSRVIEDAVTASLEYPSGLGGTLEASWSVPGKFIMEVTIEATGTRGSLIVGPTDIRLTLREPSGPFAAGAHRIHSSDLPPQGVYDLAPEAAGAAYFLQDRGFVEACRQRSGVRTGFDAATRAERVIDAIYASAASGQPVLV